MVALKKQSVVSSGSQPSLQCGSLHWTCHRSGGVCSTAVALNFWRLFLTAFWLSDSEPRDGLGDAGLWPSKARRQQLPRVPLKVSRQTIAERWAVSGVLSEVSLEKMFCVWPQSEETKVRAEFRRCPCLVNKTAVKKGIWMGKELCHHHGPLSPMGISVSSWRPAGCAPVSACGVRTWKCVF